MSSPLSSSGPAQAVPGRGGRDGGVALALRVQPGARREGLEGVIAEADGTRRLKIALTVAAEDGKANARLIALLAKRWKMPKRDFTVTQGARARRKTLLIAGDTATILARIAPDLSPNPREE